MPPADAPILVVDDDRDVREALVETLEFAGFRTVEAANGQEALAVLRGGTVTPLAVLLDLMMPVMDGYGFLDARAQDPALRAIPVFVLTAGGALDPLRTPSPPPQLIRKPIHVADLIASLEKLKRGAA